jgi:hypothetical protein
MQQQQQQAQLEQTLKQQQQQQMEKKADAHGQHVNRNIEQELQAIFSSTTSNQQHKDPNSVAAVVNKDVQSMSQIQIASSAAAAAASMAAHSPAVQQPHGQSLSSHPHTLSAASVAAAAVAGGQQVNAGQQQQKQLLSSQNPNVFLLEPIAASRSPTPTIPSSLVTHAAAGNGATATAVTDAAVVQNGVAPAVNSNMNSSSRSGSRSGSPDVHHSVTAAGANNVTAVTTSVVTTPIEVPATIITASVPAASSVNPVTQVPAVLHGQPVPSVTCHSLPVKETAIIAPAIATASNSTTTAAAGATTANAVTAVVKQPLLPVAAAGVPVPSVATNVSSSSSQSTSINPSSANTSAAIVASLAASQVPSTSSSSAAANGTTTTAAAAPQKTQPLPQAAFNSQQQHLIHSSSNSASSSPENSITSSSNAVTAAQRPNILLNPASSSSQVPSLGVKQVVAGNEKKFSVCPVPEDVVIRTPNGTDLTIIDKKKKPQVSAADAVVKNRIIVPVTGTKSRVILICSSLSSGSDAESESEVNVAAVDASICISIIEKDVMNGNKLVIAGPGNNVRIKRQQPLNGTQNAEYVLLFEGSEYPLNPDLQLMDITIRNTKRFFSSSSSS